MGVTPNIGLPVTSELETNKTFLDFRKEVAGDQIGSCMMILDSQIKNLQDNKLNNTDDIKDNVTTFTEAETRTNILSGETIAVILGKIKKVIFDLKALAFKDTIGTNEIDNNVVSNDKLAQMATNTIKGNNSIETGNVTDLTTEQVIAMLNAVTTARKINGYDLSADRTLTTSDVGALPIGGGTMTGTLTAQTNTNYTTYQVRNIALATSASTPANGAILGVYS